MLELWTKSQAKELPIEDPPALLLLIKTNYIQIQSLFCTHSVEKPLVYSVTMK